MTMGPPHSTAGCRARRCASSDPVVAPPVFVAFLGNARQPESHPLDHHPDDVEGVIRPLQVDGHFYEELAALSGRHGAPPAVWYRLFPFCRLHCERRAFNAAFAFLGTSPQRRRHRARELFEPSVNPLATQHVFPTAAHFRGAQSSSVSFSGEETWRPLSSWGRLPAWGRIRIRRAGVFSHLLDAEPGRGHRSASASGPASSRLSATVSRRRTTADTLLCSCRAWAPRPAPSAAGTRKPICSLVGVRAARPVPFWVKKKGHEPLKLDRENSRMNSSDACPDAGNRRCPSRGKRPPVSGSARFLGDCVPKRGLLQITNSRLQHVLIVR